MANGPLRATVTLLLVLLILGAFLWRRWQEPVRKELLNRSPDALVASSFARCRLSCQRIQWPEVEEVVREGLIITNRSNRFSRPCPLFTVQRKTASGAYLRLLLSQCADSTVVVDAERLNAKNACSCSGYSKNN